MNLCIINKENDPSLGYTLINKKINIKIIKSSTLVLQEKYPKWILVYDIFKTSSNYCRVANEISIEMI